MGWCGKRAGRLRCFNLVRPQVLIALGGVPPSGNGSQHREEYKRDCYADHSPGEVGGRGSRGGTDAPGGENDDHDHE